MFFAFITHCATKFGSVFDDIFDDSQKRGLFYPLFTLFTNNIYASWKETNEQECFCCI